jgi:hypothetical protein
VAITLKDIEAARRLLAGQVLRTPMLPAPRLSALTGAEVFVKYENLQVTNSFKDRGALVKLTALTADERKRGIVAMSAGNHAQAVAYHAARLGIPATIVMPVTTPAVKSPRHVLMAQKSCWKARASPMRRWPVKSWCGIERSPWCTPTTIRSSSPGKALLRWKCLRTCQTSISWSFRSVVAG